VFAGDRRVWRAALIVAIPVLLLIAVYCLRPRDYFTGTNNVEGYGYVLETPRGAPVCVPGLELPAGTARLRLQLISRTPERPPLHLTLRIPGRTITSDLGAVGVSSNRVSAAIFTVPQLSATRSATACLTAGDVVNWGGTPLLAPPSPDPPTLGGRPLPVRIAVWYLPRRGDQRSYLSRAGKILARASLFRPAFVGPWLYALLFLMLLPALALTAVRCLALAAAGRGPRNLAAWLFVIAALNFGSWAVITPAFHAPDEVDHFAYTQSLAERGKAPSRDARSPRPRWSSAESLALEDTSFFTDHQVGDTRVPWLASQQRYYETRARTLHPTSSDGGGNETAATHGPIYYAALAPAYAVASSSPFSQLTLMRLTSALIGALTVLFTYLLVRELAPNTRWLAALPALFVAYEPMFGFISGAVNNDVGVNAGAAALEWLLIRLLRRGVTIPWGLLTGVLLILLPIVKGTAYSLYPVAGIAFVAALWRHHRRSDLAGWGALAAGLVAMREFSLHVAGIFEASGGNTPGIGSTVSATSSAASDPLGYLSYLWEVFLPRLSFMAPHFENTGVPAFTIFVERGWGAFGWYDVFFPRWLFVVILVAMLAVPPLGVLAALRERVVLRRKLVELGIVLLFPIAVVAGFEAAFYTHGSRPVIAEFGRYAFPAIGPLAALAAGSLYAFGRHGALVVGSGMLVAMLGLSYAGQLVTLTGFFA
jgi:hypothetical protein